MKSKIHVLQIIFLLITTSLSACNQETIETSTDQEIFFEVNHINFAWGKQFRGFLIDKSGQIRTYDNPVKWNIIDGKGTVQQNNVVLANAATAIKTYYPEKEYEHTVAIANDSLFSLKAKHAFNTLKAIR